MGTGGQSITLANSIIGVGILAMPYCFQQCGIILATLILLFMGLVSRLCCYFLLKSAILTRRRTYELLAFHVFGPSGKLAVEVGIIGFLMGTCIAYFVVVGDLGPQIIAKLLNINQSDILRTSIMVIVSLVCVLPLGLLRNVDSLSNVSAATIGFYICLVVKVLSEASSRMFTSDEPLNVDLWKPSGVLQCVPIFSMALFCQTQLFEIFESLPTLSLERMTRVTKNAINICTGVYLTLGIFGYIAFSNQTITGNILMSLGPTMANDVIRLGFVMSLAFSFPLIIFPCRASLYSFLFKKAHSSHHDHIINHSIPERAFRCLTVGIIASSLAASLLLPDISLVLGLVGATIGVLVCVALPAATALALSHGGGTERMLAKITLILGLCIMVLGTYANLEAAESTLDRYDDKIITQEKIDKLVEDFFDKMEKDPGLKGTQEIKNPIDPSFKKDVVDSEIQPPNPVPPESQSNEVKAKPELKPAVENSKKQIDALPINEIDKASETHPKNLKSKLKEGQNNAEENIKTDNKRNEMKNTEAKIEENKKEIKIEPQINEKEKKDDKSKEPTSQDKTQEKIDLIKQQQLIETIKQHGEEQKELIKEQKEILQELKKTKDELEQNKKDVDSSEAKKIAVESIQKIADVAIKSLSGVTEKPIAIEDAKRDPEPLEKIANEAVIQIAKKAVETIEAIKEIKEIKENPKEINPVNLKEAIDKNIKNEVPVINSEANKVPPKVIASPQVNAKPQNISAEQQIVNPIPPVQNVPAAQEVIQNPKQADEGPSKQNLMQANGFAQPIVTKLAKLNNKQTVNNRALNNIQVVQNSVNKVETVDNVLQSVANNNDNTIQKPSNQENAHLHAADEPESYKQGEDVQLKPIANKVPIPLAVNNNQIEEIDKVPKLEEPLINKVQNNINLQNNGAKLNFDNNMQNLNSQVRQKREVVDCANKQVLRPEDKEICETLIDKSELKNEQSEILKNVDLNENLQRRVPMSDVLHGRSLKSLNEARKR